MYVLGLVYFSSTLVVIAVTPVVKSQALSLGMFDQPCERKVHSRPMVRLGGVAIFLGYLVGLVCVLMGAQGTEGFDFSHEFFSLLLGCTAMFLLGLADDWLSLSPSLRLCCQLLISALVWQAGLRVGFLDGYGLSILGNQFFSFLITILWLTGITNAINWIDGLDGLATGVCILSAACLTFVGIHESLPTVACLASSVLGALSGFLRYNSYPARIFMGDSGSYFLGFTLAGLCLLGPSQVISGKGAILAIAIVALPLIDMVLVIFTRLLSGTSPFKADQSHVHHRLLAMGFPHRVAVETIYLFAFLSTMTLLVLASYISWLLYSLLLLAAVSIATFRVITSKSVNGLLSLSSEVIN